MKVLYVATKFRESKITELNSLASFCELTIAFEKDATAQTSNKSLNFARIINIKKANLVLTNLKNHFFDFVIFESFQSKISKIGIDYCIRFKIPYSVYIHVENSGDSSFNTKHPVQRFLSNAESFFAPNQNIVNWLKSNLVPENKIVNYDSTPLTASNFIGMIFDKKSYKEQLNLPDKKVICLMEKAVKKQVVMQFLSVFKELQSEYELLYLYNDKPMDFKRLIKKKNIRAICYRKAKDLNDVMTALKASDIFVSINEHDYSNYLDSVALCHGVPILRYELNENINFVVDGENGFSFKTFNDFDIKTKVDTIIANWADFSKKGIDSIRERTQENSSKRIFNRLESLYKKPKVIYVTSAMKESDFETLNADSKNPLNIKRQKTHLDIIKSISLSNEVVVISNRPFGKQTLSKTKFIEGQTKLDNNIKYEYVSSKSTEMSIAKSAKIYKVLNYYYKNNRVCVFFESTNKTIYNAVNKLRNKYHANVVAVHCDSTYTQAERLLLRNSCKKIKKLPAVISSTDFLLRLCSKKTAKTLLIQGIMEDKAKATKKRERPYFFYGGYLDESHGILDLLNSYKKFENKDIDLLVAGWGPLEQEVKQIADLTRNIKYLGHLTQSEIDSYEQYALACINPTKNDSKKSYTSLPTKVLEYLSNKALVISTPNVDLEPFLDKTIIWNRGSDLLDSLNLVSVMKNNGADKQLIKKSYDNAYNLYSQANINKKLEDLISSILS